MAMFPLHMEQRMSCNLELGLSPPSSSPPTTAAAAPHHFMTDDSSTTLQKPAIFNHGGIPVADFTELRARAIIMRATREMEERRSSTCRIRSPESKSTSPADQRSNSHYMKRSLQRFLQKRKHRTQALSPYSH